MNEIEVGHDGLTSEGEYLLTDNDTLISQTFPNSTIKHVNRAFVRASGFTLQELVGKPHNIVRHPDMPSAVFADMWRTIKDSRPWLGYVKNRRRDGGFYWVHATVTPFYNDGHLAGFKSVRVKPDRRKVLEMEVVYRDMQESPERYRVNNGRILLRE